MGTSVIQTGVDIDIFFSLPLFCCRVKEFFCIEEGIYQARTPCKLAIIIIANR